MKIREIQRVATGVPGLDDILVGGLFESGIYIIQGAAGSGKTILANQICFHLARQGRRTVYYTLLTEAHDRMLSFLQQLRFFDAGLIMNGIEYVSGYKLLETEGLPGVVRNIREVLVAQRPALLVIDGMVSAEEIAPSDNVFKKFLHELQTLAAMFRTTVLALTNTESASRLQAQHTMVDGIIELRTSEQRRTAQRTLEVTKLRGAGQWRGTHTVDITSDGLSVLPRIEVLLASSREAPRPTERDRLLSGVPTLDPILHGGLLTGTNTMVLGATGTGKTLLGIHFLAAAAATGNKGLFFTFYEKAEELVAKARAFGIDDFARAVERGDIRILWQSSVEASVDRVGERLLRAFDELGPQRVFIDGMHGFQSTSDSPDRIQDFFAALAEHFAARGAGMMFTAETEDVLGQSAIRPPFANASRMCQNILLLRYAELRGRIVRLFAVIKMRDSDYDPGVRMLTIGPRGMEVGDVVESADMLLAGQPLRSGGGNSE